MYDHLGLKTQDLKASVRCYENSPNHYTAFLVDPDGNPVEAVCLAEEG